MRGAITAISNINIYMFKERNLYMSYQIYYDRAFIRAGDKFIPIVNSGSNNCFEYYDGREIPEKNWSVLNWKRKTQFLFTESEIKEIARDYELYNQESGIDHKSRNVCFAHGEFERWIINGMKNAYTVEEYVSFGNGFYVLDYSAEDIGAWKKHSFRTTDEMLKILEDLKDIECKDIKLSYNREVYRPKIKRTPKKPLDIAGLPKYYILKGEVGGYDAYFIKMGRNGGFRYAAPFVTGNVKKFKNRKEATSYFYKYKQIFDKYKFTVEEIVNQA